jgi:hypothetical protein
MSPQTVHLIQNLVVASGMVAVTVLVHFWGFIFLTLLMQRSGNGFGRMKLGWDKRC